MSTAQQQVKPENAETRVTGHLFRHESARLVSMLTDKFGVGWMITVPEKG